MNWKFCTSTENNADIFKRQKLTIKILGKKHKRPWNQTQSLEAAKEIFNTNLQWWETTLWKLDITIYIMCGSKICNTWIKTAATATEGLGHFGCACEAAKKRLERKYGDYEENWRYTWINWIV